MNKAGVSYNPCKMKEEEENVFGDNSESSCDDRVPKKDFPYDDVHIENYDLKRIP